VLANVRRALFGRDDDPVKVDRFVILERVGKGAMGVVYAAYDPKLDRKVALKLLSATSESARRRALREARALARVSDPNVVVIHDAGEFERQAWVAMELVAGSTLERVVPSARGWPAIVRLFCAAGRGLAAAHEAGIVHRDFKPANVLVGSDGRVRVVDFGLAHLGAAPPRSTMVVHGIDSTSGSSSSRAGQPGTLSYMAPEQLEGNDPDARADQFAFCVALFEALFGHRPFVAPTRTELLARMRAGEPAIPARPRIPSWLGRVLRRGLSLCAAQRYPSMRALVAELESHDSRPARGAVLAIAVGLVAAASAYAAGSTGENACSEAGDEVAAIWTDRARNDMEAGFHATGLPYADRAWTSASGGLDAYAQALSGMRIAACEARSEHRASDVREQRRDECLRARSRSLADTVRLLGAADRDVVARASEIVDALPEVELCAHETVLASTLAVPDSEAERLAIEAVRDDVVAAEGLRIAGRYSDAEALATDAAASAQTIGYSPLVAEASATLASSRAIQGDTAAAERMLRDALFIAETSNHVELAARIATDLLLLLADDPGRTDHAEEMAARCWTDIVRAGEPQKQVIGYLDAQRLIHTNKGDYEEALAWSVRAVQRADDPLEQAVALSGRGTLLDRIGRGAEAVLDQERALDLVREIKGADHPQVAVLLLNVANARLSTNEAERARGHLEEARAIFEAAFGPDHDHVGQVMSSLSLAHDALGDRARAIESAQAAIRIFTARDVPYLVAGPRYNLAALLLKSGASERALAEFEAAHRLFVEHGPIGGPDPVYTLHGIGETLLAMERPHDAVARLEEARTLAQQHGEAPQLRALVDISLGKALFAVGRERERGAALVRAAVAELGASPGDAYDELEDARTWLREHAPE
jgi:tetratricopeptide (TPR) repeat protein